MADHYDVEVQGGGTLARALDTLRSVRLAGLALALVLFVLSGATDAFLVGFASVGVLGVALWVLGLAAQVRSRQVYAARAVVTDEAITLRDRSGSLLSIPRGTVLGARIVRRNVGHETTRIDLDRSHGRRTRLLFGSLDEARAFLRATRLSPRERPTRFRFFFGLRVTVGADGVLFHWPLLRRRRFLPYAKILAVRDLAPTSYVLRFELANGRHYEVITLTFAREHGVDEHHALVERIDDACSSYRAGGEAGAAVLLERGARSAAGWIKDLRTLTESGGTGYRVAMVPPETLWDLALDPAARPELRVGAVLALRVDLDDDGRRKLHDAAEASASPRVRVALEAAAAGLDDDGLEAVLDGALPARARRA
ncbi:MAG: hypothetical protein JWP97_4951 [Labilithrix sp.]|nr:hypothetical protein [Labilithrix sp.]